MPVPINRVSLFIHIPIRHHLSKTLIAMSSSMHSLRVLRIAPSTAHAADEALTIIHLIPPRYILNLLPRKLTFAIMTRFREHTAIVRTIVIVVMNKKTISEQYLVAFATLKMLNVPEPAAVFSIPPDHRTFALRAPPELNLRTALRTDEPLRKLRELPGLERTRALEADETLRVDCRTAGPTARARSDRRRTAGTPTARASSPHSGPPRGRESPAADEERSRTSRTCNSSSGRLNPQ
jgi:hypothetical protein